MQQAMTYRERSHELLARARAELDTDLAQAGEKGWGAAASIVKAVAVERGWDHETHRVLYAAVGRLYRETEDQDLRPWFASANELHINFYENWFNSEDVEVRLREVEEFVARVEALLSTNP